MHDSLARFVRWAHNLKGLKTADLAGVDSPRVPLERRESKMKNRILLSVVSCAVLALPGIAQQSNSSSNAQPAAMATDSQSASDRGPIPADTSKDFWDGDDPNLVNLVTHPFANKKYVQRQVGPIRDRINELDQLTSENSRVDQGRGYARNPRHSVGVGEKSILRTSTLRTLATRRKRRRRSDQRASTRVGTVEQMVGNLDQYKDGGQTEIRFQAGQTVLSKSAKDALDAVGGAVEGSAQLHHRGPGIRAGTGRSGDCQLAKDGGFGGAVPGAQSSNSGLPGLCDEYGQYACGWRRRDHGETQQRRSRGSKCDEE